MTESKPTRGHYTFVHQFNVECDRRGIANCGGYSPSHGQQEAFEENKANARLIAAAPVLLAALELVTAALELHAPCSLVTGTPEQWKIEQARAAITKATKGTDNE